MITDDPGTPGNGHWEINLEWTTQQTAQSTLQGAPLIDANYGIGDRIQINYQSSWALFRGSGDATESGPSDSQLALKWRYYDAGADGLQLSIFPRVTFPDAGSSGGSREIVDTHPSFLFPLEARRDFGVISVNADIGHVFSSESQAGGWIGGLCVGRDVAKGWELDAEIHFQESESFGRDEVILNAGTRWDFSEHATLLLAIGRDAHNALGPRISFLASAGVQFRL